MTQIGEGVAAGGGKDPNKPDLEENHWLELEYRYQNGAPIYGTYEAFDSEGMLWTGRLNDEGQVCLAGLPAGNVQVSLLPEESTDKELEETRKAIQTVLDQIIEDQRAEAEEYERELEQMGGARRAFTHIHSFGKGLWSGAVGVIEFVGDTAYKVVQIADYLGPINQLGNVLKAGYQSYQSGDLTWDEWYDSVNENLQNEHKKDVARLLGVEPDDLSEERLRQLMQMVAEAYDIAAFIADDQETQDMLKQFAEDMADAQHSVEWAEFAGAGVFELVLGALLAIFTGGAGNVAQATSKLRHAARLRNLGHLFRKLARLLRRKKLNKSVDAPVDQKTTTNTDQPDTIDLKPRYTSDPEVEKPKAGDRIHKRVHTDGAEGDRYTLQSDGRPMGAEEGPMPAELRGMKELPSNHDELVEEGWPTLNHNNNETFRTFTEARPVELPEGTKIYRIVDETNNDAGAFWAYELPANKTEWRSGYAVKDGWNDNGYYVEHEVGEGGLKAWEGPAAGQPYEEIEGKEFYLGGGDTQLFLTPGSMEPSPPQLTDWPEW
ncbi:hypothetical protein [Marinimicrobium agarilyticum]|uniref:hypothetical protein n=1 Tax=Marinimicrobium agarilyticum TaxID=306546 RepID=UPI000403712B|nr:hypothetical protein [Marinimicrobium agarilyticum]